METSVLICLPIDAVLVNFIFFEDVFNRLKFGRVEGAESTCSILQHTEPA